MRIKQVRQLLIGYAVTLTIMLFVIMYAAEQKVFASAQKIAVNPINKVT